MIDPKNGKLEGKFFKADPSSLVFKVSKAPLFILKMLAQLATANKALHNITVYMAGDIFHHLLLLRKHQKIFFESPLTPKNKTKCFFFLGLSVEATFLVAPSF